MHTRLIVFPFLALTFRGLSNLVLFDHDSYYCRLF